MPPLRRTSARKSVTPTPARLCFFSNPCYGGLELPAASNDVLFDSELGKAISPAPELFSASSAAAAEAVLDPNNAALDTKDEDEVFVPFNDAVFVPSSECSAGMEVLRDECKVDRDIVESGKYDIVEDGCQQVVVDLDKGGKAKKVVKKTVKVVKIVKRKVRKKLSNTGADDNKVDNVAGILSPDSRVSCVVESKKLKPGSNSLELNMQNSSSHVEEAKENALMEVDNNGVVQEQTAVVMEVDEDRNGEYEHRSEDVGIVDRQKEEEEEEEKEGEAKYFSATLEAMERRKRRKTEVFLGGLDKDAKEEDVRNVFGEAGEIVDLTVAVDSKTGKNRGYACVRYATAEEAKRAREKFPKVKICGKGCGAAPVEKNDTIFLGNIDKKWKNEDIIKTLQGIGIENIDKVTVMVDQDNSEFNCGFAFIELETSKDAQIAYKKLQKEYVSGWSRGIKVAWAKPLKEFDEEELLKVNVNVSLASVLESKIPKSAAKPVMKQVPNNPKISHRSDPALVGVCSVPSYIALKARVISLEKQGFDALSRAFKAEEANSKAENVKEASKKKIEAKKEQIKNLKKKHKNEVKDLRRKQKAVLKKAEDWGFNKGREYQLDLMKEALAFFDEKFRFKDFAPSLEYIEDERKKTLEAAAQDIHSKAEHSTSLSKAIEPLGDPTYSPASSPHEKGLGEEEGQEEEQEGLDEEEHGYE